MKKIVLLIALSAAVFFLLVACQQKAKPESHLDKLDWQKMLSEAQKNKDYGMCQDVVIAAYLDRNRDVLFQAADICWPIGWNDPHMASDWANMRVETEEEYIIMVGKALGVTPITFKQSEPHK